MIMQLIEISQVRSPDLTFDSRLSIVEQKLNENNNANELEMARKFEAMEEKIEIFEKFLQTQQNAPYESRLKDTLQEISPDAIRIREEHTEKLRKHDEKILSIENVNSTLLQRVTTLEQQVRDLTDITSKTASSHTLRLGALETKQKEIVQSISILSDDLESKLLSQKKEMEAGFQAQIAMLNQVEKVLDTKADIRIVLDKVSRLEFATQVKKLMQSDDDIASKAVARDEYKNQLSQLKESIMQDQQHRQHNIARYIDILFIFFVFSFTIINYHYVVILYRVCIR
jgi:hypothetical protein